MDNHGISNGNKCHEELVGSKHHPFFLLLLFSFFRFVERSHATVSSRAEEPRQKSVLVRRIRTKRNRTFDDDDDIYNDF